jgi:hypothetical protein
MTSSVPAMAPGGWLVLCSAADPSALWVYERLRARGRAAVSLMLVESLAAGEVRWDHRVDSEGATLVVTGAGGARLDGRRVRAVLNRVLTAPLQAVALAEREDRDYATHELTAFAASWLRALSATVINQPDPRGTAGRIRPPLEWRVLAARAGMPTAAMRIASDDGADPQSVGLDEASCWVLAIDGRVLHAGAPAALHTAVARLGRHVHARVLGLRFCGADPAAAGWRLMDASPSPDLSLAGERGVAALEQALSA